jgi:hypothetical protein
MIRAQTLWAAMRRIRSSYCLTTIRHETRICNWDGHASLVLVLVLALVIKNRLSLATILILGGPPWKQTVVHDRGLCS